MNYPTRNTDQANYATAVASGERATALASMATRLEALGKSLVDLEVDVARNAIRTFGAIPEAVEAASEASNKHSGCSLARIEAAIRDLERIAHRLGAQCRRFDDL